MSRSKKDDKGIKAAGWARNEAREARDDWMFVKGFVRRH